MLINDNGVTREMTEEEIAEHNKPKPAPSDLGDVEQKAAAFDYLTGRSGDANE